MISPACAKSLAVWWIINCYYNEIILIYNNQIAPNLKRLLKITFTLIFTIIIVLGFTVPLNPVGNWYQQFMPNIGSRQITDITFLDSLNGYAVATQMSDTSYVLKTSNRGDTWQIVYRNFFAMTKVQFLDINTGYACGGYLYKTINGGINWTLVNTPSITVENMFVLNQDTIWIVWSEGSAGGVFFTTNGGASWQQQVNLGGNNPDKIYMYNARIGFISRTNSPQLRKTTNGGVNWNLLSGTGTGAFSDIYFIDSLTGWKAKAVGGGGWLMGKSTDGGINWVEQILPSGGNIISQGTQHFSNINKDTIWSANGVYRFPNNQLREILYRTTNGGDTWYFQIPDTSIIMHYEHSTFINKLNGWFYDNSSPIGIHTTTGGDTTFYLGIQRTSSNIPKEFELKQNYPNPFNPRTVIPYKLKKSAFVRLIAYEITGKETQIMVNQHQQAGEYEVDFIGKFAISSGIYFYRIEVTDDKSKQLYTETKKMVLIK